LRAFPAGGPAFPPPFRTAGGKDKAGFGTGFERKIMIMKHFPRSVIVFRDFRPFANKA
jgi:hypothetical protein